ncbi:MAG: FliH/SctL family protein [Nannocystaceae bacterium]|nr:flagellar assembly protein FliH [bacterium]
MTKLRPFVPPPAPRPTSATTSVPAFPVRAESSPQTPCSNRAFVPPPLHDEAPEVDLQAMLDAAQQEVDALQAKSVSQAETLQTEKSRYQHALSVIERSRVEAARMMAKDAVMLGIEIGHALAAKAFEVDRSQLITLMNSCLQEFSTEHPVQVRVAPADADSIRAHLEAEGATSIEVHGDDALSPGDLSVEAEQLVIDSRLTERVQNLREALAATVRSDEQLEPDAEDEPEA